VGANWGLRGVVNDQAEFAAKRYNARANYFYVKAELEHQRPLWKTGRLRADLKGQWSESPLISNEQFSAGGVESVRGYVESERLGDTALQLNLELHSPSWITPGKRGVQDLHAMVFADAAQLNVKDALPKQESRYNLSGAGVGLHAQAWGGELLLDVAWPFANAVDTRSGDPRVHFSAAYQF
jgi:hemolysin activation/secretion protein